MKLLSDHVWRPLADARKDAAVPCQYLNCRRPKSEHERAVSQVSRWSK